MTHLSVGRAGANHQIVAPSAGKKTSTIATQSFGKQLSQAFSETLSKQHDVSKSGKLPADDAASQTNVTRQNAVIAGTLRVPAGGPPVAASAPTGFNALVAEVSKASGISPAAATVPAAAAPISADDLYWSRQPAAVQKLRDIGDQGQRSLMAGQLAAQGYYIDTPVMVWGWDAAKTTQLRQGFGYTWIPSAMQFPVTAAPGITGASIIPYDPAHPPQGSIPV